MLHHVLRLLPLLMSGVWMVPTAAQSPVVYNATLGSLPSAQCFTHQWGPATCQIVGGELHVGPTPVAGGFFFERTDFPISFNAGFVMEATFRVVTSGCGVNPSGHPRYGLQLSATDATGSFCGHNSALLASFW